MDIGKNSQNGRFHGNPYVAMATKKEFLKEKPPYSLHNSMTKTLL